MSDVQLETFRQVLALVKQEGLTARNIRVGEIEVSLGAPQPQSAVVEPDDSRTLEQQAADAWAEYERIQYAAAEGPQ